MLIESGDEYDVGADLDAREKVKASFAGELDIQKNETGVFACDQIDGFVVRCRFTDDGHIGVIEQQFGQLSVRQTFVVNQQCAQGCAHFRFLSRDVPAAQPAQ